MSSERVLEDVLVRAPLLGPGETLATHPLGALAIELGSASLTAGLARGDAGAPAALERLERRARFRATPHRLWAGVALGTLGETTAIEPGPPVPWLTVAYGGLVRLGRRLLEDWSVRRGVHVLAAPSLLRSGSRILWLAGDEAREADVDELLDGVLRRAARAPTWPALARAVPEDVLLSLIDDELLVTDLVPPLVGPEPAVWLARRLADHPAGAALRSALRHLRRGRITEARATLATLPGELELHAVLTFPAARAVVSRRAVERAAQIAPLLGRLAAALVPPVAERDLDPQALRAITTITDQRGAGAFPASALALGDYGVRPAAGGEEAQTPDVTVVAAMAALIVEAARAGRDQIALDELAARLPAREPPPTQELLLTPSADAHGQGWLLALHAPAGASWGRFAHALGAPFRAALRRLAAAEPDERLDLAFAPSAELADLAAHPPIRKRALGLSTAADVSPAALSLAADELALYGWQEGERPVSPSPLARLRSTTVAPGVYRLLAGWALERQHAPWGLVPAPLLELPWLPRMTLGGFVVSPQSWRLDEDAAADPRRWREQSGAPRHVQIGVEDELLPVDLDDPHQLGAAMRGLPRPRAHEIWPAGRRFEVVASVVRAPAPRQPLPVVGPSPPAAGWRTYLLHAPPDRHDEILAGPVAAAVAGVKRWFFVRYVSGERHHLRIRVHGDPRGFEARLRAAFPALETAPYFPETARYGGPRTLRACEEIFQRESELALIYDEDPVLFLVRLLDATAAAFGLRLAARRSLAVHLRTGEAPGWRELYRARQRELAALLGDPPDDLLARHVRRLRPVAPALLPSLLHMTANRIVGVDGELEGRAIYLWERTLEGLAMRRR